MAHPLGLDALLYGAGGNHGLPQAGALAKHGVGAKAIRFWGREKRCMHFFRGGWEVEVDLKFVWGVQGVLEWNLM